MYCVVKECCKSDYRLDCIDRDPGREGDSAMRYRETVIQRECCNRVYVRMGEMGVTLQWARYSVMLEGYNARVREYRDEKGCCKREREYM